MSREAAHSNVELSEAQQRVVDLVGLLATNAENILEDDVVRNGRRPLRPGWTLVAEIIAVHKDFVTPPQRLFALSIEDPSGEEFEYLAVNAQTAHTAYAYDNHDPYGDASAPDFAVQSLFDRNGVVTVEAEAIMNRVFRFELYTDL